MRCRRELRRGPVLQVARVRPTLAQRAPAAHRFELPRPSP
jgi:hypothetical protein